MRKGITASSRRSTAIITQRAATSGNLASGTVLTVTLPTYQTGDFIVLFLNRNQTTSPTFGANVTATQLASCDTRLMAYKIVPTTGSETTFTVTATSAVWTWWCASYYNVDASATVASAAAENASNTTATITQPVVSLPYITTGKELNLFAAGVNSTATWTTGADTIFNTTANNAALMIAGGATTANRVTASRSNMDRGNSGSTRSESAISLVLQPKYNRAKTNLLTNASFEAGAAPGTSWENESTVAGTVTYSMSTSTGVVGGGRALRMQYTGVGGDNGTHKAQFFQAPINGISVGQTLRFGIYISGSWTNAYALIGVESFQAGGAYISGVTTNIVSISGTPTRYTVDYTVPAGASYAAVFVQSPEFPANGVIDLYLDEASLVVV